MRLRTMMCASNPSSKRLLLLDQGRQGATFEVVNPVTERVISVCANAGEEDVDEAVKAARKW